MHAAPVLRCADVSLAPADPPFVPARLPGRGAHGSTWVAGKLDPPQSPAPAKVVRLAPADAARMATEERREITVEMPPGPGGEGLRAGRAGRRSDRDRPRRARDVVRRQFEPRQPAARHPRTSDWVPIAHTLKTHEDLQKFYERELAPARSAGNGWIDDLNKDGSHDARDLSEMKERLVRIQDTDGDGVADVSQVMAEGFNADPAFDVVGGLLYHGGDLFFGIAPGVWRMRDDNGDGAIDTQTPVSLGYNIHPAFGGHGISASRSGPTDGSTGKSATSASASWTDTVSGGRIPIRARSSARILTGQISKCLRPESETSRSSRSTSSAT